MVRQAMAFPDMDARAVDQAVRAAVTDELSRKGYARAPGGELSIRFTVDMKELVDIDRAYGLSARDARVEEGELVAVFAVYFNEAATGTNVWRVETEGPWNEGEGELANVSRLVQAALRQVPRHK